MRETIMTDDRLQRQLEFILEIDKLKLVLRRSRLLHDDRAENSAEHSWHVAMMAYVLAEHADVPVDMPRVVAMLLMHDVVEIDAGDTYVYDEQATAEKDAAETRAAERIFGLLPDDQAETFRALWDEYEARVTPEAKFARALDRLMPLLHNIHTQGQSWRAHGVTSEQVRRINSAIADGSQRLWDHAGELIDQAVANGHLAE